MFTIFSGYLFKEKIEILDLIRIQFLHEGTVHGAKKSTRERIRAVGWKNQRSKMNSQGEGEANPRKTSTNDRYLQEITKRFLPCHHHTRRFTRGGAIGPPTNSPRETLEKVSGFRRRAAFPVKRRPFPTSGFRARSNSCRSGSSTANPPIEHHQMDISTKFSCGSPPSCRRMAPVEANRIGRERASREA